MSIFIIFKGHIGTPAYIPFYFNLFYETALIIPLGVNILEWMFHIILYLICLILSLILFAKKINSKKYK